MSKDTLINFALLPNYQPGDTVEESNCGGVVEYYTSAGLLLNVQPSLEKCPRCVLYEYCTAKSIKGKKFEE